MRVLEWDFVGRLQVLITNCLSSQNCDYNALLYSLAMLNKSVEEQGNHVGYYFGSINMISHVQLFLAKEQAWKALLNVAGLTPRKGVTEYMEERSTITLAALEQRKQKRLRPVTEDPAEVLGEEPADEPAEEPAEEPPQALHTPAKEWNECDRVQFTDVMKLELLRVWIVKTENALIRASTPSGKAPFIKQMLPLLEEGVGIMVG